MPGSTVVWPEEPRMTTPKPHLAADFNSNDADGDNHAGDHRSRHTHGRLRLLSQDSLQRPLALATARSTPTQGVGTGLEHD